MNKNENKTYIMNTMKKKGGYVLGPEHIQSNDAPVPQGQSAALVEKEETSDRSSNSGQPYQSRNENDAGVLDSTAGSQMIGPDYVPDWM